MASDLTQVVQILSRNQEVLQRWSRGPAKADTLGKGPSGALPNGVAPAVALGFGCGFCCGDEQPVSPTMPMKDAIAT